jgi:hypothetical protein
MSESCIKVIVTVLELLTATMVRWERAGEVRCAWLESAQAKSVVRD